MPWSPTWSALPSREALGKRSVAAAPAADASEIHNMEEL